MNAIVETLNLWGERWASFAWPMLIQSSLLIAVLWVIDLAIRQRVRAVVRYTLGLLLLIKLIVPPGFAFPTGAGYWMGHPHSSAGSEAKAASILWTSTESAVAPPTRTALVNPATPTLGRSGVLLLLWLTGTVSLSCLVWHRSRTVSRRVKEAAPASPQIAALLETCRRQIGFRRPVDLRIIEGTISPAVCGWWRPVILIPHHLLSTLSTPQLRAVILHELAHLSRGDLRVNSAQTVLQILYWWHPLLWLANAHLRRVREQAVDELVMFTLADDAPTYPATLLEVAKLAFKRPALSLGFIGIVESSSALNRRITRLLNHPVPRVANLGFVAAFVIALIALVLLPMARGQHKPSNGTAVSPADPKQPEVVNMEVRFIELSKDEFDQLGLKAPSVQTEGGQLVWVYGTNEFAALLQQLKTQPGLTVLAAPRITSQSGVQTRIEVGDPSANSGTAPRTNQSWTAPACDVIPQVNGDQIALTLAAKVTESGAVTADSNGLPGLGPVPAADRGSSKSPEGPVYAVNAIGYIQYDVGSAQISVTDGGGVVLQNPGLKNSRGKGYLVVASPRIDRSAKGAAAAPANPPRPEVDLVNPTGARQLATRTFKVNPTLFLENLRKETGNSENTGVRELIHAFLGSLGFRTNAPNMIYFNDREGLLFLRGPLEELDLAHQAIDRLLPVPAQIMVETRFVELRQDHLKALGLDFLSNQASRPANPAPASTSTENRDAVIVLTASQAKATLQKVREMTGVDVLSAPRMTTLSGRQAEISVTQSGNVAGRAVQLGPRLELLAMVADDGFTIGVNSIATLTETTGKERAPEIRTRQVIGIADAYDGQTIVLGESAIERGRSDESTNPDGRRLLVFITPTIIDPAGSPVHTPDRMPFREDAIPPSRRQL